MKDGELDSIDKRILYYLQQGARGASSSDIAEKLGLLSSTVRTRFSRLEGTDIVHGYHAGIGCDLVGYPLCMKIACTALVPEHSALVNRVHDVYGATAVREIMAGERNVYVDAIGTDHNDLNRVSEGLDGLGLDIVDEQLIRDELACPCHGFLDEDGAGR